MNLFALLSISLFMVSLVPAHVSANIIDDTTIGSHLFKGWNLWTPDLNYHGKLTAKSQTDMPYCKAVTRLCVTEGRYYSYVRGYALNYNFPLTPGVGYYVFMTQTGDIGPRIAGSYFNSTHLCKGWNLIGQAWLQTPRDTQFGPHPYKYLWASELLGNLAGSKKAITMLVPSELPFIVFHIGGTINITGHQTFYISYIPSYTLSHDFLLFPNMGLFVYTNIETELVLT